MNAKGSASRGELTKAMGATIQTVRKHEMQIAAMLEGIQQLMDGQAALGEQVEAMKAEYRELSERLALVEGQAAGLISRGKPFRTPVHVMTNA